MGSIAIKYGLKLMAIDGMGDKCKALSVVSKVMALTNQQGIKDTGYRIVNNAANIYNTVEEFKNAADLDAKLVVAGKVIRYVVGIETL